MTQISMLGEIDKSLGMLASERSTAPADLALSNAERMVKALRGQVASHWPLTRKESQGLLIARYTTRILDPDFPDLVVQLVRLERLAQEGGAGKVECLP